MTDPDQLIYELEATANDALEHDTLVMVTPQAVLGLTQYVRELEKARVARPEVTDDMLTAFWSKTLVTSAGSIIGLANGIEAALLAAPNKEPK